MKCTMYIENETLPIARIQAGFSGFTASSTLKRNTNDAPASAGISEKFGFGAFIANAVAVVNAANPAALPQALLSGQRSSRARKNSTIPSTKTGSWFAMLKYMKLFLVTVRPVNWKTAHKVAWVASKADTAI